MNPLIIAVAAISGHRLAHINSFQLSCLVFLDKPGALGQPATKIINMCLIVLGDKEFVKGQVDRYWEWKKAGRERRRKFLYKILPFLRPAVSKDQHRSLQVTDQHPVDGTPPNYASETSLFLSKEVTK
jgi:hypothetical protein